MKRVANRDRERENRGVLLRRRHQNRPFGSLVATPVAETERQLETISKAARKQWFAQRRPVAMLPGANPLCPRCSPRLAMRSRRASVRRCDGLGCKGTSDSPSPVDRDARRHVDVRVPAHPAPALAAVIRLLAVVGAFALLCGVANAAKPPKQPR